MKTILLCRIDGNFGGVERYILTLAQGLDRDRYQPVVVALGQPGELFEQARSKGLDVDFVPMSSRMEIVGAARRLGEIVQSRKADLLHTFGIRSNTLAYWLRRTRRIPWIVRLPNINSTDYAHPFKGWLFHQLNNGLIRRADALQVISPQLEQYVRSWNKPPKTLFTILNGVNTEHFNRATVTQSIREIDSIPQDAPVVGSVGRLDPIKGYDVLIRAFSRLAATFPKAHLILVGGGADQKRLEQQIQAVRLQERIHITGFVNDVRPYLAAMDIFVCSSYSEGVPMAMLEAMAMEVPVVTTRVGGIESIIQDGRSGLFIPSGNSDTLADVLEKLIEDAVLRTSLRSEAYHQAVTNFSDRRMIESVQAMYRTILCEENSE